MTSADRIACARQAFPTAPIRHLCWWLVGIGVPVRDAVPRSTRVDAMDPAEILTRPAPPPDGTIRYGPGPDNIADVRLPSGGGLRGASAGSGQPLVVVLHGGFWRAAFDRKHVGPMAAALAAEGYLVCVPEFRRVGQAGGGWPGTFDDVAAAVDRLPLLVAAIAPGACDPGRLLLLGHSAGAHLALWAAGRHLLPRDVPWRARAGQRSGGQPPPATRRRRGRRSARGRARAASATLRRGRPGTLDSAGSFGTNRPWHYR